MFSKDDKNHQFFLHNVSEVRRIFLCKLVSILFYLAAKVAFYKTNFCLIPKPEMLTNKKELSKDFFYFIKISTRINEIVT
jgi:hypothetical protein